VSHASARLNDFGRGLLITRVLEEGWTAAAAAEAAGVSRAMVYKWLRATGVKARRVSATAAAVRGTVRGVFRRARRNRSCCSEAGCLRHRGVVDRRAHDPGAASSQAARV
jgi:hypothetical protein